MNSNDVNSIIDNLCEKLGTTANKLIPEMAGYYIARESIWLIISLIFIGIAIGFIIKLIRMKKSDDKVLMAFPDKANSFIKIMDKHNDISQWTRSEVFDAINYLTGAIRKPYYDDAEYGWRIFTAVWSGGIGAVIFGTALTKILGWILSPNAMAFMWIINNLKGGQ